MPGLLRGIARTAVVAGTATAVSNRVSRRQARRWGAEEERYAPEPAPPPSPPPPPAPAAPASGGADDMLEALERLGRLRDSGVLTDAEFATQKQRILGA